MSRVVAVVVTYNRRDLLLMCLQALARQTAPLARVVLVDNASSDGTEEAVRASGVAGRLRIDYLRMERNGGGAEGFHYGMRAALEGESDWLWLMDDDCEPRDDCLERLLAVGGAEPGAAVVAPVVVDATGRVLPINRGHVRPRWFFSSLVPASLEEHRRERTEIEFCSFVGPLVRTAAARRAGLPLREMFIRFEDVEYLDRIRLAGGRLLLAGRATIAHRDPQPVAGAGLGPRWREYRARQPFASAWKQLYGVRNQLYAGRRGGWLSGPRAASQVLVQAVRVLLFGERRPRMLALLVRYALDGWRGRFRNVPPARWPDLDVTLDYDSDVARSLTPLRGEPSPPTPQGSRS